MSEWKRYRNRADHSVVYTARLTKAGDYQLRGPGLGPKTNLRAPAGFFEETYESYEPIGRPEKKKKKKPRVESEPEPEEGEDAEE